MKVYFREMLQPLFSLDFERFNFSMNLHFQSYIKTYTYYKSKLKKSWWGCNICCWLRFFYPWGPSNVTLTEEIWGPQGTLHWKIKLIRSHSMRVSWSGNNLFSWPSYTQGFKKKTKKKQTTKKKNLVLDWEF